MRLSVLVLMLLAAVAVPTTAHAGPSAEVLVGFRPGVSLQARSSLIEARGGVVRNRLHDADVAVVDDADALRLDPRVTHVQPNYRYRLLSVPADTYYGLEWHLNNTGQDRGRAKADIRAEAAWTLTGAATGTPWTTSGAATIAMIDSGVHKEHQDLTGKIIQPCKGVVDDNGTLTDDCTDVEGHGTQVAGVAVATTNNSAGVASVAFNSKLYVCRAQTAAGSISSASVIACVDNVIAAAGTHNIRVLNISLGTDQPDQLVRSAMQRAVNAGILIVAAAGNGGAGTITYPAGFPEVVSVGATGRRDQHPSFSATNSDLELTAPGVEIVTTAVPNVQGQYALVDGTSVAAPIVSAVAALASTKTQKTGEALRSLLIATADDLGLSGRDDQFGYGRVNFCRAMGGGADACSTSATTTPPTVHRALPGLVRNSSQFYLRSSLSSGPADKLLSVGSSGDQPVMGDWDGNGSKTPGVFRNGIWYLRNSLTSGPGDVSFAFGAPGDTPIVGRWTSGGCGCDRPGVIRGRQWFLRLSHTDGPADVSFSYGDAGDYEVAGDWNGDGTDTPGVFRGGIWYLRNSNSDGPGDMSMLFASPGDRPLAGDWDGDGKSSPAVVRGGAQWFWRNSLTSGAADGSLLFGDANDTNQVVWS